MNKSKKQKVQNNKTFTRKINNYIMKTSDICCEDDLNRDDVINKIF